VQSLSIDLHSHSTYSDGVLSPAALVQRAVLNGVTMLGLTDHDEVGGLTQAATTASEAGIVFVPGVEISVTWAGQTVHVLGLGIDPNNAALADGLTSLSASRQRRAVQIAAQLEAAGIPGSLSGASRYADNPAAVGRAHFARYLVAQGHARSMSSVFKRYLTPGKPGYVTHQWASLENAMGWIHAAGGCSVLAHPDRYRLSVAGMHCFLDEFKQRDGEAIEISGGARANPASQLRLARHFGFALSVGSDFHAPGEAGADLGETPEIPGDVRTVWQRWQVLRVAG
jgi:predicted metal-dependent phosphoesterase TrpH